MRSRAKDRTFKLKVDKEGNVVDALPRLGQFGEDQEAAPSLAALGQPHALPDGRERLKVAFSDAAGSYDANCPDPAVYQEDIGDDDADGEDPLGHVKADLGPHLARPLVEGEEINGGEGVGGVDGARSEDEDPQPNVGKGGQTGRRLEVRESLVESAFTCSYRKWRSHIQCNPTFAPR